MKNITGILIFLIVGTLATYAFAKTSPPSLYQDEENGWLENGKAVRDSDNIKSKNGFGAQLWIINDNTFFENWDKPETPRLPITKTAVRNVPVYIIVLFINPGVDHDLNANVTADVMIKSPDGKIYGDFKDVEIWKRKYQTPSNHIQLGIGALAIKIEDHEQIGTYTVEAKIKDDIKKTSFMLKTDFVAKDK